MPNPDFAAPFAGPHQGSIGQGIGRVNFAAPSSAGGAGTFGGAFAHRTQIDNNAGTDALRGNWEQTPLSQMYFSHKNIRSIQDTIKKEVFKRSGENKWVIDDQNVDELMIIMRAMFLQYARNMPTDIGGQVSELNSIVIEWVLPRIMSEVQQHFFYLRDISEMPKQIERPINVSSAGTKSFDLTTKFF